MRKYGDSFFNSLDVLSHTSGFNYYSAAQPLVNVATSGFEGGVNTMKQFWDGDNPYQTMGGALGDMAYQASYAGVAGYWALDTAKKLKATQGIKLNNHTFGINKNGTLRNMKSGKTIFRTKAINAIKSQGREGYFNLKRGKMGSFMEEIPVFNRNTKFGAGAKGTSFFKRWRPSMGSVVGMALAPIIIGGGMSLIGNVAGKLMDSSMREYRDQRQLNYDDRRFDSGMQDHGSMWKMNNSSQEYQSRIFNTARIYHSR